MYKDFCFLKDLCFLDPDEHTLIEYFLLVPPINFLVAIHFSPQNILYSRLSKLHAVPFLSRSLFP